jgi:hypothetical protein
MTTTVTNIQEGTEVSTGPNRSASLAYHVAGASTELDALAAVAGVAPVSFNGLPRTSRSAEPLTGSKYLVRVSYELNRPEDSSVAVESSFEFNTGGGSETMYVSRSTVGTYSVAGLTAPSFSGGINVTDDGPQGVDRVVPVYQFSETHTIPAANVTGAYKAALFGLTGTVNNAAFKGFAAGEVLFLGARGTKNGSGDWEINFSFNALPNVANATFGPFTGVNKKGWEYLWFLFEEEEDATAKRVVRKPVAAYVERIYPESNFAGLGIGTT